MSFFNVLITIITTANLTWYSASCILARELFQLLLILIPILPHKDVQLYHHHPHPAHQLIKQFLQDRFSKFKDKSRNSREFNLITQGVGGRIDPTDFSAFITTKPVFQGAENFLTFLRDAVQKKHDID